MNNDGWRLRDASEFDAVFRGNRFRVSSPAFLLLAKENNLQRSRLGMVIGKKNVKLATQRNRTKRVIRERFRQHFVEDLLSIDLIVLAKAGVNTRDRVALNQQVTTLMEKLIQKFGRQDQHA